MFGVLFHHVHSQMRPSISGANFKILQKQISSSQILLSFSVPVAVSQKLIDLVGLIRISLVNIRPRVGRIYVRDPCLSKYEF